MKTIDDFSREERLSIREEYLERVRDIVPVMIEAIEWVEPGYSFEVDTTDLPGLIVATNWWNLEDLNREYCEKYDIERADTLMNVMAIECVFDDEYGECNLCGRVFRTSPDCYGWKKYYFEFHTGERWCAECCEEHAEEYINAIINERYDCLLDPYDFGFVMLDDRYANGWYHGDDDDPRLQVSLLNENGLDVLFKLHPSQFTIDYDIYVRPQNGMDADDTIAELAADLIRRNGCKQVPSPEENLKEYFRKINEMKTPEVSDGVIYTYPDKDGNPVQRVISREEFIERGCLPT